jgi:hypothetical protein
MTTTVFACRARRGAAWLDQTMPGWFQKVDPISLDIGGSNTCVIGQLYGDYNKWVDKVSADFARRHGFYVTHVKDKNWDKQQKAWIDEIYPRQQSVPVATDTQRLRAGEYSA